MTTAVSTRAGVLDTWLGWAGLRSAGRRQPAERVRAGVLDALARIGDHPEPVCVDLSGRLHVAPLANRVKAWTLGARRALMHEWHCRVH